MRAEARTSVRALSLTLLMITSTQMILLTTIDFNEKELGIEPQRYDVDNSGVSIIDLGFDHSCVIGTLNQMKCWGDGSMGKTGHENTADYGDNEKEMGQYLMFTDVGSGLTFTDVSSGMYHTCALISDGSVRCWGQNELLGSDSGEAGSGARGDGYLEMGSSIPIVNGFGPSSETPEWSAVSISVGSTHSCSIVNNGTVDQLRCWGESGDGQLGLGSTDTIGDSGSESMLVDLPERGGLGLSQVSAGHSHTCILWSDGEMACWGDNSNGQLGIGSTETIGDGPDEMGESLALVDLPPGRTATYIEAGEDMTCAILDDETLACWGWGDSGRLGSESTSNIGDSPNEMGANLPLVDLGDDLSTQSIGVGYGTSCAILDDGNSATPEVLKCWGKGDEGVLGYGGTADRGGLQNQMGNFLLSMSLGTSRYPTSVDVGDSFACAVLDNSMVKCWGSGVSGKTGLGMSGATGDENGEMGESLPYVELFLPEETVDQPCESPAEGAPVSQETLDSRSSYVGNKTSSDLTPDGCGVVAYIDETNDIVRFGIFYKGKWTAENVFDYSGYTEARISDVSLATDSNGIPHVVVSWNYDNTPRLHHIHYYTKVDGDWSGREISIESGHIPIANSIEIDGSGNLYIIYQTYAESMGSLLGNVYAKTCSAAQYGTTQCQTGGVADWTAVPNDASVGPASLSHSLDTDITPSGNIHVAYISNSSCSVTSCEDEPGYVMLAELDSNGFGTPTNTSGFANVSGQWEPGTEVVAGNSSLALDLGLDGSIHIAYLGSTDGIHYNSCSSSCGDQASWSSEDVTDSLPVSDTGVIDIAVGSDLSVLILAGTQDGTHALQKSDGTWGKTDLEEEGGAKWASLELSGQGKMWAFAFYPGTPASMTTFVQEGVATAGLLDDIDGDGWTRLDEMRCGTGYSDPSSTPVDSDGDGTCDIFDDWEDTPVSAESDSLAIGESFGCAVLANGSVACWGDNSEGQLGSSSAGSNSLFAILVDLPSGFDAGAVDAGSAHACATGLNGSIVCWGRNTNGQLGRGTTSASELPGYVILPEGVMTSQYAAGADHNCMTGSDSNMYCWGNGEDDRTGKIVNVSNLEVQYESFADNSRSWTSTWSSFMKGPGEGLDYVYRQLYGSWWTGALTSDYSFSISPGDVVSFRMRGEYHGNNNNEYLQIYAGSEMLAQIDGNSTTSGGLSSWQEVEFRVPDSYTGSGAVDGLQYLKISVYGYYNSIYLDDLRVISNLSYGSIDSVTLPSRVNWDESSSVSQISLGARHSCALMHSGSVKCWGYNGGSYSTILGSPDYKGESTYDPKEVDLSVSSSLVSSNWTSSTVVGINAGHGVTCAMMRSGEALCWGDSSEKKWLDTEKIRLAHVGDVGRSPALTTDANGNWIIAYNDDSGISYSIYDHDAPSGSTLTTTKVCLSSDMCHSAGGVGIATGADGGIEILSYDQSGEQLVSTNRLTNKSTMVAVKQDSSHYEIARDPSSGDLHLVYHQISGRKLMHKTFNGTDWSEAVVIDEEEDRTGNSLNGIGVDSSGGVHIVYWDWDRSGTDDSWLKYGYFDGSDWVVEILQSFIDWDNPTRHASLVLDSGDNPHISYYDPKNQTLRYTHHDGSSWIDQNLTQDDGGNKGKYNSIALDSNDYPRISYKDESADDLLIVSWDGASWSNETVDVGGDVGDWSSIAIDSDDRSMVAYRDNSYADLILSSHDGSEWTRDVLDDYISSSSISLEIDSRDRPRIAYQSGNDEAMLAYNNGESPTASGWQIAVVMDGWEIGNHMSMTLDRTTGTAYMSYEQEDYPDNWGLVTTYHTGTTFVSTQVASTGDLSNSVDMGPEPYINEGSDALFAPYLNGTDGASPAFIEMARLRDDTNAISMVEGLASSVGSYGISMDLDPWGNQQISYHNSTAGSLMYSRYDGTQWHTEVVDIGYTGYRSSIAVDASGNPHIAYVDQTTLPRKVMYAYHNGTSWEIEQVDSPYYAVDTSIDLDSGGGAHIAYGVYDSSLSSYNMRYSYHNGTEWVKEDIKDYRVTSWNSYSLTGYGGDIELNSTDVPHIVFFDDYYDDVILSIRSNGTWSSASIGDGSGTTVYGGLYTSSGERGSSLAFDSTDGIHVAYYGMGSYTLGYTFSGDGGTSWNTTSPSRSSCSCLAIHDQANNIVGSSVSIEVDSLDRPHIAFHDRTDWDLEYAMYDGSEWYVETLESFSDVGNYPQISIDSADQVHIAYQNSTGGSLMSLVMGRGALTEKIAQVGTHHYGMGFDVSQSGNMHLSFYNGTDTQGALLHATKVGLIWEVTTVDESSTIMGAYSDLALDQDGNPHISYVDSTNGFLRYAHQDGNEWTTSTVDPSGNVVGYTSIAVDDAGLPRISYHDGSYALLAVWDGSSWSLTTEDDANAGRGKGTNLAIDSDGKSVIAYFDESGDDLWFAYASHQSPVMMGNSQFHRTGTSLGSGVSGLTSMDIGETHGCAVSSGNIICWGVGSQGQLGVLSPYPTSPELDPVEVVLDYTDGWTALEVSVSTTSSHYDRRGTTCALFSNNSSGELRVQCWGATHVGQVGSGAIAQNISFPYSMEYNAVQYSSGVYMGASESRSSYPFDVVELSLSEGTGFGCARSSQGHVKCWGRNNYGQLGHGNTSTASDGPNEMGENLAFVPLGNNSTASRISAGGEHVCAILDDGSVKCWGRNTYGQLGIGSTTTIGDEAGEMGESLATVDLGPGRTATDITTGQYHTCALLDDGSVKCWGYNVNGQLGLGSTDTIGNEAGEMGDSLPTVDLGSGRTAISIEAGAYSTCAILDSGVLKCWGFNNIGQLGQEHTENVGTGIDVDGNGVSCITSITDSPENTRECNARMGDGLPAIDLGDGRTAVSVSAGIYSTCAILDNGSVRCWGQYSRGILGIGTSLGNIGDQSGEMGESLPTVDLGSGRTVTSISVSEGHVCALLDNLSVACWGYNGQGQLGIGSTGDVDTVEEMGDGLQTVDLPSARSTAVSAGFRFSCAIIDDGTVRCWGEDNDGRLGVYSGSDDNIGNEGGEMGAGLSMTNLHMAPGDFDADGWIDLWDEDDDNDGYLDAQDDLPFDQRDWIDDDGDGLGLNVDTDDDDPDVRTVDEDTITKWSDSEEAACGTLPWSSLSEPTDYDGDGICDAIDDDVDGNGWNDTYQCECSGLEASAGWNRESVFGTLGLTAFSYDYAQYGYDFALTDHGIRFISTYYDDATYQWLQRHDSTTFGMATLVYKYNDFNYWDIGHQNGIFYLASETQVTRLQDYNGTLVQYGTYAMMSHASTTSSDIAISQEGDMVVRWHESSSGGTIRGAYLNGSTFYAGAPGGLTAPDTGGNNQHGQIAFGPNGRLHALVVNNSSGVIGFYHFYADLGSDLSGEVSLSWSTPELLLERNQSTGWSSGASHSATEDHSAELHYSEDGKMYAAMYNGTDLWLSTHDGSSWTTEMVSGSTGKNEGVEIATNSTGVAHIAWINHTTGQLMLSHKSSGSWSHDEVWQSDGWPESTSTQTLNWARLTLRFDRSDDPYIMSLDANDSYVGSGILHYKGSLLDPSYTFQPADSNGDGICDTLQYAVMDYGTSEVIVTKGEAVSLTPTFDGQELVEVWAQSLPDGLSVNNTTGVITGTPNTIDTAGTTFTIYANSSSASYPVTITFTIRTPAPVNAGYGTWHDHQYLSTNSGRGLTLHEYDEDGNLYYYGRYGSTSAWSADGISVSIGSGDLYVAKRWANGTWAWVVPMDMVGSAWPGALSVDESGNSYITGQRASGGLDLPGTEHDLPSREAAFFFSLDTNGSTRWSQDAYISGSSDANWMVDTRASVGNYGFARMRINESNGEMTVAGQISTNSASYRTVTLGNLTMEIPSTNYNYYRPFVVRINSTGEFTWANTVSPSSTYHRTLQGMGVHEDGSVEILMRAYGETQLGDHTAGSDSYHYVIGRLNGTGTWTGATQIVEADSGFSGSYDSAMMQMTRTGELVLAMWSVDEISNLSVNGQSSWFNETCDDSLVVMSLSGPEWSVGPSREFCLTSNSGYYAEYSSLLEIDAAGMPVLFLGQRQYSVGYHHRILRLDSNLNPDFEEFLEYANNPANAYLLDWDDVAFDPLGNMLVNYYTSICNLWWNGSYVEEPNTYCNYNSQFFMETVGHTIGGSTLVAGEATTLWGVMGLSAMGATCSPSGSSCDEYLGSWESSPLPDGLILDSDTGVISGTATSNMSESSFTLWMNDTSLGNNQIEVSFSILNGRPTVSYDQTTFVLERGSEISPIVPLVAEGEILNWTFLPALPSGLHLGESNGTIYGTPSVNLTQQTFQLRVASEGGITGVDFQFTINEPVASISYGNGTFMIPRDALVRIEPELGGGAIESFGINSTSFPLGLSFNTTNGYFEGIPLLVTNLTSYTVWANNSGGSTSTEVSIWIVGNGIFLSFPTDGLLLTRGVPMQPIAGQTSGSTPESWEISPDLPQGLNFGASNGTIWGTPVVVQNQTNYTIWSNASGEQTSSVTISITVLLDTDGDWVADLYDQDDDNDGWNDTAETDCGTDPLDSTSYPNDTDSDGLCDDLDDFDDRNIAMIYGIDDIDLIVNVTSVSIVPITSGGDIQSWEVSPALLGGLQMNDSTGEISGVANTSFPTTVFTIWANNSAFSVSFNLSMSASLLDTDGDGEPDVTDDDDDDDGWGDDAEADCGTGPLNSTDYPSDEDGDGLCDLLDLVDDSDIFLAYPVSSVNLTTNVTALLLSPLVLGGDVTTWQVAPSMPTGLLFNDTTGVLSGIANATFEQTEFTIWANNSLHSASFSINISSWRVDSDGDGVPDEFDPDDDDDGWTDEEEESCQTSGLDNTSFPADSDGDGECDLVDLVDDSPISLAFPTNSIELLVNLTSLHAHPIVFGGEVRSWDIHPEIAPGLSFSNATGILGGISIEPFGPVEYVIWANNSQFSANFSIEISSALLDTDGDGEPDETDPDDDDDGWGDSEESACLTGALDPLSYPEDGDGDGLCDGLDYTDDSELFLVYSMSSQLLFVNEPIEPINAITYGGDVRTWEVWPPLPMGLSLNGALTRSVTVNGTISGIPVGEFPLQVFTVWANNSQYHSSVEITLQSVTPDPDDDDFDLIYLDEVLNITTNLDEVYLEPQIFGGNVTSWSISPQLPTGLEFNETNGLITGFAIEEVDGTIYKVTGSNSLFLDDFEITVFARHLDTDGDGVPDIFDQDDDGDGWNDTIEVQCGTEPLDIISQPEDHDEDRVCDPIDDFDDSPIVFFYPIDKLVLTVGEEMEPLEPLIAPNSGGITLFSVLPALPAGLILDNATGVIYGTPEQAYRHVILEYSHTFSAENDQWKFSYRVDFDIFWPIDNNTDDDGDGWDDLVEVECFTDPMNASSFPEDIDLDGICSHIDEDDDGDNIGDAIDKFPKNPIAWDDTDGDGEPDEVTCRYLTDTANCTFDLIEDLDDDNDGWLDLNETSCGTNPKDNSSVPEDDDGDGVCNLLEVFVPDAVKILWICCFPLLLLLLLLLWVINPFAVREDEILGPEPEYTSTEEGWENGSGEYDDPFILKQVNGVRRGGFARSHEVIKVSNISPRLDCDFTDMSSEQNGSRFRMGSIQANSRGDIEFRLEFNDDGGTSETTEFTGLIRLGKATVYFEWTVEVEVRRDTPEEEQAKKRASRIEREARKKAAQLEKEARDRAADAEIEAKKEAAKLESRLKSKVEQTEKEAAERMAAAEMKAAKAEMKAAQAEREAAEKEAAAARESKREEEERRAREEREKRVAEEEAAEKAAEEERKAEEEAAELRAILKRKAEERKEAEAAKKAEEAAALKAAEEEAARIEKEAEEAAARLKKEAEDRAAAVEREAARKAAELERVAQIKAMEAKEKLRKRAVERKRQMDLEEKENDLAREKAAERFASMERDLEERRAKLEELDAEAKKKESALLRVAEKSRNIDFGILGFATVDNKQDLQEIKGVGPFIEEKLNALGIFTFAQISRMNSEMEDRVNEAIEFFPGRIKRDEWALQARKLIDQGESTPSQIEEEISIGERELLDQAKDEIRMKDLQEKKDSEIERRRAKAQEMLKMRQADSSNDVNEEEEESAIDFSVIGFGSEDDKDDLQRIDGIGRFVEKKLNDVGIYKFSQIANMSQKISEEVNDAIGLGPGRIERDEWVLQAKRMVG